MLIVNIVKAAYIWHILLQGCNVLFYGGLMSKNIL